MADSPASSVPREDEFDAWRREVDGRGVLLVDENGRVLQADDGAALMLGASSSDDLDAPAIHFEKVDPADALERAQRDGSVVARVRLRCVDGEVADTDATFTRLGSGCFGVVLQGSTSAAKAQRNSLTELNLRRLVDSVNDYAIFLLDTRGCVQTWNAGAQHIKGYTAEDIIGSHFSRFYPAKDVEAGKCEHELAWAAQHGKFEEEGWRLRKDGSLFWANVVITAVRDEQGTLTGFGKVTRDLTDRRRADERLRAAENQLRELIDSIQDYAIFLLDPTGHVASWNSGAQRIKGYTRDEILGQHFSVFYPSEDIAAGKCEVELAAATSVGRFEDEGWRLRQDGSRFWANVVVSAVRNKEGNLVGFSKVTRDLTARKRMEEEQVARVAAEQANRAKDEFMAILGHELRNPLAPIVTALQVVADRHRVDSSRELQIIERQVSHMVRLVDDLLDIARFSQSKIRIAREPVGMLDVLSRAIELANPLIEERRHRLEMQVAAPTAQVHGDDQRLVQALANLLSNAAKYTEPGGCIDVSLRVDGDWVVVSVQDSGRGMSQALVSHVFDLFVQGSQPSDRSRGGLGIGLALVRSIAEMHGGSTEAWSAGEDQGSTFTLRLPRLVRSSVLARATTPSLSEALKPEPGTSRVLVVDDNQDALFLLASVLREAGHEVVAVGDGIEALQAVKTFAPHIGILDLGLPIMDGYELAKLLPKAVGCAIRLIALSGYGQQSDRDRSKEAGFEQHLVKPVRTAQLLEALVAPLATPLPSPARR